MPSVLILCTGNSARSQMAEGLFRHESGGAWEAFSAGTRPTTVRAEAIAAMREIGIDISQHRSKSVDEFAGREFDYVITVCDHAQQHPLDERRGHIEVRNGRVATLGGADPIAIVSRGPRQ